MTRYRAGMDRRLPINLLDQVTQRPVVQRQPIGARRQSNGSDIKRADKFEETEPVVSSRELYE